MYGIKGIDHLAKPGLLKKTLCGSYPSGPSSSEPPLIWKMIGDNSVAAYNMPSGILFDMHREAAAKRPGVLTKVGLDTFVDPRHQGCAMNAAASEPIVSQVEQFDGEEWLYLPRRSCPTSRSSAPPPPTSAATSPTSTKAPISAGSNRRWRRATMAASSSRR